MQFRRRREKKTDYRQRLSLLRSGKPRLVVRKTSNSFRLQIIEFQTRGDRTLIEISSSLLRKHGWKGHAGDIPSAYLSGMLIGKTALKKGIQEVVPDMGMQISVKGSSLYACLAGARDAGLKLSIGKDVLPSKERIEGRHVAEYAKLLKKEDSTKYSRHFSLYLKKGLEPEKLPEHFRDVLNELSKSGEK